LAQGGWDLDRQYGGPFFRCREALELL